MFNSSRLRISVDRAENERQRVFYQLDEIRVGDRNDTDIVIGPQSICGTDNRVASTERRVGASSRSAAPRGSWATICF